MPDVMLNHPSALSKAGVKVAHLDNNPYYGGDEANLTLDELARWADSRSTSSENSEKLSSYLEAQRAKFTSVKCSPIVPDHSRHYSISLAPSLIPSVGPLISSLIASGVSRYGGYRLLERVGIYSNSNGLQNVPGSKEDVFKSTLTLIEKRRLMRFLVFASGEFEGSKELQGHEQTPFPEFLQSQFSLTQDMVDAIAYALAFCFSSTGSPYLCSSRGACDNKMGVLQMRPYRHSPACVTTSARQAATGHRLSSLGTMAASARLRRVSVVSLQSTVACISWIGIPKKSPPRRQLLETNL